MFLEHSQERQKLNAPLKIAKDKDASGRFEFSVPKFAARARAIYTKMHASAE